MHRRGGGGGSGGGRGCGGGVGRRGGSTSAPRIIPAVCVTSRRWCWYDGGWGAGRADEGVLRGFDGEPGRRPAASLGQGPSAPRVQWGAGAPRRAGPHHARGRGGRGVAGRFWSLRDSGRMQHGYAVGGGRVAATAASAVAGWPTRPPPRPPRLSAPGGLLLRSCHASSPTSRCLPRTPPLPSLTMLPSQSPPAWRVVPPAMLSFMYAVGPFPPLPIHPLSRHPRAAAAATAAALLGGGSGLKRDCQPRGREVASPPPPSPPQRKSVGSTLTVTSTAVLVDCLIVDCRRARGWA